MVATWLELAERFTSAFAARDAEGIGACYAENVVVWHNDTRTEQSKQENIASVGQFFAMTSEVKYASIVRIGSDTGFIQQHDITGTLADGRALPPMAACLVFTVADGLVTRLDEYVDPTPFRAMFAGEALA